MDLNTWQDFAFSQLKKAEELMNQYCHILSSGKSILICIWCLSPHFGFRTLPADREAETLVLLAKTQR